MAPKRDGLHIFRNEEQRRAYTKSATLYIYIRSDENTYALHETFFHKRKPFSPDEWDDFIRNKVLAGHGGEGTATDTLGILKGAIIPGINLRTQKIWDVRAVIGYMTHDLHWALHSTLSKARNKTKSSRVKTRQNNIRRGHRNRKGKTK